MHSAPRRKSTAIGLVAAASLALSGLVAIPATAAATVTHNSINDPGNVTAGNITLSGAVTQGSDTTTTVLYIVDATNSTSAGAGGGGAAGDCDGSGAVGPSDDLNGDGVVGDVLDCELGAVQALDTNLAGAFPLGDLVVGAEAFATPKAIPATGQVAQLADLNTSGQKFAPPTDTGGEAQPRNVTAVRSITRGAIARYTPKTLAGPGLGYDPAIDTALASLAGAPAGPKWVMLLSDGKAPTSDARIASVRALHLAGGFNLSSFAVGSGATCDQTGALAKLGAAGGGSCHAASAENLAGLLTGAQPDFLRSVTVTIGSTDVAADLIAAGGWQAKFTLGQGTYTATSTAVLTSGATAITTRTFSVGASVGAGGPAPGTVTPGPGALSATVTQVNQPKNTLRGLPESVSGLVGVPDHKSLKQTKRLVGASVLLQARATVGATWTTVARTKVVKGAKGAYSMHWKPLRKYHFLRVTLAPFGKFAASSAGVPTPRISACTITRSTGKWSATCHTTVTTGSKARVMKGSHVADHAKVHGGLVKVHATGKPGAYVLVIDRKHKRHTSLAL